MQNSTSGPAAREWVDLGVRKSKIKVTRGRSLIWRRDRNIILDP